MRALKQFLGTIIGILVIMFAGFEIPKRITVTVSDSVKNRIFYKQTLFDSRDIKQGAYVQVELFSKVVSECQPCLIIKRVAGIPGDLITVHGKDFFCNGEYLGKAKEYSMRGTPLESYTITGLVPDHKIFLMGDSPDSFDSRYYGPMEIKHVKAVVRPIF